MSHTSRKTLAVAGAAVLSLTAAACGGSNSGSGTATGGAGGAQPYIAIVSKGFQQQFWQSVKKGAEQEAKKQNVRITFEGPADETKVEDQVTMLQNVVAKKPNAIAFAALDSKAAQGVITQIQNQKIPMIAFDSGVDSDYPVSTAATDNVAAATEAGKHMCTLIGGTGHVGVIAMDQTSKSSTNRRDGFIKGIQANCPNVKVNTVQYSGGDQAKSADIAKSMISSDSELKGIFGANEGCAIGIVKGVTEAGKAKVTKIVGFDSGQAQIDAINSGVEAGAITQNPIGMGEKMVDLAVKAIKGEAVDKTVDTGFYWYDKSNIADPKIAELLYK